VCLVGGLEKWVLGDFRVHVCGVKLPRCIGGTFSGRTSRAGGLIQGNYPEPQAGNAGIGVTG